MKHSNLPDIAFQTIRPLKNSKNKGFEELCVQLFRSSFPDGTNFYRVDDAGGDGGVEDIAYIHQNRKVGLQAKFFDKLDSSQWSQINKSVKTALKKHYPELIEYRIAAPVNRSKESQTWDNYVTKWNEHAKTIGYKNKIQFEWFGDSELRGILVNRTHWDKVYYWFGCPQFSEEWLQQQFQIARKNLDDRYTPKCAIRTEAEKKLDAYTLTKKFRDIFLRKAKEAIDAGLKAISSLQSNVGISRKEIDTLRSIIEDIRTVFEASEDLPEKSIIEQILEKCKKLVVSLYENLQDLRTEEEPKKPRSENYYSPRPFSYEIHQVEKILETLDSVISFTERYVCYDYRKLLIFGEAGTGKSHLLSTCIEAALERHQPALLVLGDQFSSSDEPFSQLQRILGWSHTVDELLSALSCHAQIVGMPAIIAIDAINESSFRSLWYTHLIGFAARIAEYPDIRLIISCRSDFIPITLPKPVAESRDESWAAIEHYGFGEQIFEAVSTYFANYSVKCDHFPPLLEEFRNPLFLKTFCEAFQNEHVPTGPLSFDVVMRKRIDKCATSINRDIGCSKYIINKAIRLLAEEISKHNGRAIPHDDIRPLIDEMFSGVEESKSLYHHLRSNGLIVETVNTTDYTNHTYREMVRFPYERFSDYFIADHMLEAFSNKKELVYALRNSDLLNDCLESHNAYYEHRGLLKMLAVLIPERFGCEFIYLLNQKKLRRNFLEDYMASLPWRNSASFSSFSDELLAICERSFPSSEYLKWRLKVATIPGHPYNAKNIHESLKSLKLHERELIWTIPLADLTNGEEQNIVDEILQWAFNVPEHLISNEQAELIALLLTWMFSSNFRFLRKRASLALIRILRGRSNITAKLVEEFHNCNDPYVVERVYAVACGVAMRETDKNALRQLSDVVYKYMFDSEAVPPNILQRDYAQSIIEYAHHCGVLSDVVKFERCQPLFQSKWPRIISEAKAKEIEKQKGWSTIQFSIQPLESGWYGDFGRYTMESLIHSFSRRTLKQSTIPTSNCFSGMTVRRWVLQRIKRLGWTPDRFGNYEERLHGGRLTFDQEQNKVERISKKYQWIALYEFLGYLSDRYRMACDSLCSKEAFFAGAWQIWARDFDPTQLLTDPAKYSEYESADIVKGDNQDHWLFGYPDPFADTKLRFDRAKWVTSQPDDFAMLINHESIPNTSGEWLTLSGHFNWEEKLTLSQDEAIDGQLKMWTNIRCWLIKREEKDRFLEEIGKTKWWGNGLDYPYFSEHWLGEYPWASSMQELRESSRQYIDSWIKDVSAPSMQTVCGYHNEKANISARLPGPIICDLLKLRWVGEGFKFVDDKGNLAAFCPEKLNSSGYSTPLLVRETRLLSALNKAGLDVVWAALSERSCYSSESRKAIVSQWAITQRIYLYENDAIICKGSKEYPIPL